MRISICVNPIYPEAVRCAAELQPWLKERGHQVKELDVPKPETLADTELLLVIGGDGTIVRAARNSWRSGVPLLGVNCGHLGCLTECEPVNAIPTLEKLFAGEAVIEERAVLTGEVVRDGTETRFFALNEAVIHRGAYTRTLKLELLLDGLGILRYSGDGLLVCTPTGSTAYNVSAGGPVMLPTARMLALTPVCAFAGVSAPIVIGEGQPATVRIDTSGLDETGALPQLEVDGCQRLPVDSGTEVRFRLSKHPLRFVTTGEMSLYKRLQKKMTGHI